MTTTVAEPSTEATPPASKKRRYLPLLIVGLTAAIASGVLTFLVVNQPRGYDSLSETRTFEGRYCGIDRTKDVLYTSEGALNPIQLHDGSYAPGELNKEQDYFFTVDQNNRLLFITGPHGSQNFGPEPCADITYEDRDEMLIRFCAALRRPSAGSTVLTSSTGEELKMDTQPFLHSLSSYDLVPGTVYAVEGYYPDKYSGLIIDNIDATDNDAENAEALPACA